MENMSFGQRLKAYRKKHNLTQQQMAKMMHLSSGHISSLERSEKWPKQSTVRSLQALEQADDWQRFGIVRELNNEEFQAYMSLWQRMRRLGPEKEREVMQTFLRILELL